MIDTQCSVQWAEILILILIWYILIYIDTQWAEILIWLILILIYWYSVGGDIQVWEFGNIYLYHSLEEFSFPQVFNLKTHQQIHFVEHFHRFVGSFFWYSWNRICTIDPTQYHHIGSSRGKRSNVMKSNHFISLLHTSAYIFFNVFVQLTKCICAIVFVWILKCICLNYITYLSRFQNESPDEAIVSLELSSFHTSANLLGSRPRFISIWMETFRTARGLHSLFARRTSVPVLWWWSTYWPYIQHKFLLG